MIAAVILAVVFALGVAFTPRQRQVPQDRPTWHKRPPR